MANKVVPSGLTPKPSVDGSDKLFGFRGTNGEPVIFTATQLFGALGLKTINGTSIKGSGDITITGGGGDMTRDEILTALGILPLSALPPQKLSNSQFQQIIVNGVVQDIEHNMDWFNAAVRAVGISEGWGGGTPATPLAAPVLSLGTVTETTIPFSISQVSNAASYDIYRNGTKIANTTSLTYTSTGLTASTQYTHYAISVPTSGQGYSVSQPSNTLTASTTAASTLPTPTAPTVVFNSSARTLGATHPNYPSGLERRYNGGAWENWADTASVYVGNDAVAANVYEWRVKAVSGVNVAGTIAGNTAISATVVVTPGLTNVVTPQSINKMTFDASTATFTRNDGAAGSAPYSLLKERVLINSSTSAIYQADEPATNGGMSLVLHTSNGYTNTPYIYFNRNPANPKVEAFFNINGGQYIKPADYSEGAIKLRFKIEGLQITPQYSSDGGVNWIGSESATLPTGITLWGQVTEGANGTTMANVKQSGFSIA